MSFPVILGSFAKRHNSTKQPIMSEQVSFGHSYPCVIKQGTDILSPVLGFDLGLTNNPVEPNNMNYAYIDAFKRFYFIKNWEFRDRLWWAYLQVDSLASFKNSIANQEVYVLRSASHYNNMVPDSFYSKLATPFTQLITISNPWTASSFSGGTYVIGVLCKEGSNGAVSYYALSPAQMKAFRDAIMSDSGFIVDIQDVSQEMAKALINPFQYIVSAVWFPFAITGGTSTTLNFGWWETNVTGNLLNNLTVEKHIYDMNVYPHPQAVAQGGGYRYSETNSVYTAFIPPFGEIDLNAGILAKAMTSFVHNDVYAECQANLTIDLVTGNAYCEIVTRTGVGEESILAYREGKVGVPTQLGQITQDVAGASSTLVHGLASAANARPLSGAMEVMATGIDVIQQLYPKVATSGGNGTTSVYALGCYIESVYYPHVSYALSEYGAPLYAFRTISGLSGYIKTLNADIAITHATLSEQEEIKAYMDGGFFYE